MPTSYLHKLLLFITYHIFRLNSLMFISLVLDKFNRLLNSESSISAGCTSGLKQGSTLISVQNILFKQYKFV